MILVGNRSEFIRLNSLNIRKKWRQSLRDLGNIVRGITKWYTAYLDPVFLAVEIVTCWLNIASIIMKI